MESALAILSHMTNYPRTSLKKPNNLFPYNFLTRSVSSLERQLSAPSGMVKVARRDLGLTPRRPWSWSEHIGAACQLEEHLGLSQEPSVVLHAGLPMCNLSFLTIKQLCSKKKEGEWQLFKGKAWIQYNDAAAMFYVSSSSLSSQSRDWRRDSLFSKAGVINKEVSVVIVE